MAALVRSGSRIRIGLGAAAGFAILVRETATGAGRLRFETAGMVATMTMLDRLDKQARGSLAYNQLVI
jgi:hypothetical protein